MGSCNCKDRDKHINTIADIEVPSSEIPLDQEVTNGLYDIKKKSKPFLKLKTQKSLNLLSTEKLFIRGKTIKGLGHTKANSDEEGYAMKSTNCTEQVTNNNQHKRTEILRKLTEKNPVKFNSKDYGLTYSVSQKDINSEEEKRLLEILVEHYLFQNFPHEVLRNIIEELDGFQVEAGTYLYKEGEEGNCFFIIKSGSMESLVKGQQRKLLQAGQCFGELALMQTCTRTTTLRAVTDVEFYVIEGAGYREYYRNLERPILNDTVLHLDLVPWLKSLNNNLKNNLARLTINKVYQTGQNVCMENSQDSIDKIYIIKKGIVSCQEGGHLIKKLSQRDYFGEKWVLLDESYGVDSIPFDVTSLEKSEIYVIYKNSLEEALGIDFREVIFSAVFKALISKCIFFTNFYTDSNYERLLGVFRLSFYQKGNVVYYSKSETNKKMLVILEGAIVDKKYELIATKGELFGEEIINSNDDLQGNLIAYPECIALECAWDRLKTHLKNMSHNSSVDIFKRLNNLKKIELFKHLPDSSLLEINNQMTKQKYKCNELIFYENSPGEKFYILVKGRVRVSKNNKTLRELEIGSCFGELSLLNDETRSASVVAITKVNCYILNKGTFLEMIDDQMMDCLKRKICLEDSYIKLSDLYYLCFLGKGKFGNVYLVHNGAYLYAVKVISKKLVDKQKSLSKYLLTEKKIHLTLDHQFVVKMVKTLKTENFVFFLMDFINGINLEDYLMSRKVKKNVNETKFYGALMLVVIDYLHSRQIAHRDMKPSNMIIDSTGYLKLIDFGTAKIITDYTHTVIGSPHFMAPEIIAGKGYSVSCDFWSVGVCMYFIHYGVFPFGNSATDVMEIYKEITHKDLSFPESINSYDLNTFITVLLSKRISTQLCKFNTLSQHSFFKEFAWKELINSTLKPPFVPKDLREWSSNLRNLNAPFEHMSERFDNLNYQKVQVEDTPMNYNIKWTEDF